MNAVDAIGVVREHRRLKAKGQAERLKRSGCRAIYQLGKGGSGTRAQLEGLVRGGTVVRLIHTFLLAEPMAKGRRRRDLLAAMARIEERGGVIEDVDSGLTTADTQQRYQLIELATEHLARDGRGLRSAENGRKGRPLKHYDPDLWPKAEAIWNNRKLKTWADTAKPLRKLGLTPHEAWRKFGART